MVSGASAYFGQWADLIGEYAPDWTNGLTSATRSQTLFQGFGLLQGSFTHADIVYKVSIGEISKARGITAIWIHATGMAAKTLGHYAGTMAGAFLSAPTGPFVVFGAIAGDIIVGGTTSVIVDFLEQQAFELIGV